MMCSRHMSRPGTQITFWDPTTFFPHYCQVPCCVACGAQTGVQSDGWPTSTSRSGFLPIIKTGGVDWIYCRGYRHPGCPMAAKSEHGAAGATTWNTLHKDFLKQLDEHILQQLPGASQPFTRSQAHRRQLRAVQRIAMTAIIAADHYNK
eukprot:9484304-Pyramimonas_sp.AAC.1